MNMEASRWWLHLAKAGDLEVVVACADIAERERDRIGSSMGGRVSGRRGRRAIRRRPVVHRRVSRRGRGGGGIHRCGSLRADDCGLIDRGGFRLGRSTLKERRRRHERLIRVEAAHREGGRRTESPEEGSWKNDQQIREWQEAHL